MSAGSLEHCHQRADQTRKAKRTAGPVVTPGHHDDWSGYLTQRTMCPEVWPNAKRAVYCVPIDYRIVSEVGDVKEPV